MSYNIRSLRDDRHAVARVIRAVDPDVLCIQEAPRFLCWRHKCRWLARATGLRIASGGRVAAANMIMVRPGIEVQAARSVLFTKDPRLHQRGLAMALLNTADHRLVAAGTHLDGWPEPRLRHVRELFAALDAFVPNAVPFALAGDFNDDPGSAVWDALSERGADVFAAVGAGAGFTLNVTEPTRRIDGVFASPGLRPRTATALDSPDVRIASDHRPFVTDLELGVALG
ncbi:MAG TPA: endonuclease/exonuclease/phosphatase family protein [Jatrophihabitantaceae bacterium]|jgi:endonuclease/exonuclease/phosphatase family metal-dependent hydrolase